jgi:hypothetical protein
MLMGVIRMLRVYGACRSGRLETLPRTHLWQCPKISKMGSSVDGLWRKKGIMDLRRRRIWQLGMDGFFCWVNRII